MEQVKEGKTSNYRAGALLPLMTALLVSLALPASSQQPHPSESLDSNTPIYVMHVQGQVYMLVVGGANGVNITAQVGDEGIVLVDSGPEALGDTLLETISEYFDRKPVRYLINTHAHADHTGGNQAVAEAFGTELSNPNEYGGVRIISHLSTLNRLSGLTRDERDIIPEMGRPYAGFFTERMDLYLNGESIVAVSAPDAHTDGDLMVWFRSSDVLASGDTFVMGHYPVIDPQRGGGLQGLIDAATKIVDDVAVAEANTSGGTRIVPGHGRLTNEAEVLDYLLMLTVVQDRVQTMVDRGMTLEEVKAVRPTLDYDGVYGGDRDFWTPEMFLDAVYREVANN